MRPRRDSSFGRTMASLAIISCLLSFRGAIAAEGGTTHYLPGAVATLIDLAPTQPGWVIEPIYLHYEGDAATQKEIPIAGLDALGLKATTDVALLGGFYTFEQPVLGAYYSVGAMLPYVWLTVEGTVDTALGRLRRRDSASGLGSRATMSGSQGGLSVLRTQPGHLSRQNTFRYGEHLGGEAS